MSEQILVIDDDQFLAQSLSRLFEGQGYQVRATHGIEEGWEKMEESAPELIVLDLGLPDGDGVALCRRLRGRFTCPVLMLTSRGESIDKVIGFEAGADDYLVKPFDPHELLARVKALLRRQNDYARRAPEGSGKLIVAGPLAIDLEARIATVGDAKLALTHTEFDLLAHLASNLGRAIHRDHLFNAVWGYSSDFSSNSLDVLIYRLRAKLRTAGGGDPIKTVRAYGFRMAAGEDEQS
jgi:DNA-binding response OmpR family regulator